MPKRIPLRSVILELLKSLGWAASYKEISVLPTSFLHVAIYLELLLQSDSSYSALEAAVYGIRGPMVFLDYPILVIPTL